jgi:hypothetical protein
MKLNIFGDKKSLIFINSKKEFLSMVTDEDFINLEDFEIVSENGLITYQSETNLSVSSWERDKFESFRNVKDNFDLLVEVSFEKPNYYTIKSIQNNFAASKKMTCLKLMTFEIVDCNSKKIYEKRDSKIIDHSLSSIERIDTLVIKPKKILKREIENGTYSLRSLIQEFKRDNKLDDLGI